MNKISVIIPIYNVEQYLPQCLDSVINQTYQNLEIILVNDGSTDHCPKICEDYAAKDSRIKVIHKENGGLSDARNAGLKIATGQYISFVDSDDLIAETFCEKLLDAIVHENADVVECNFSKFETELLPDKVTAKQNHTAGTYNAEKSLKLLMEEKLKQVVWNKMYRKESLSDITFPVNTINEDEYWTYKVYGQASRITKIQDVLYFYRQQATSIMGKKYSLKRLDGLKAMEQRISYMKKNFPALENLAIKKFCFGSIFHYQQISQHSEIDTDKKHRKKIVKGIKNYGKFSVVKKWQLKEMFWYYLFIFSPQIYQKVHRYNEARVEKKLQRIKRVNI